jgi:nucleoside-diphosphate-sugar epimerase
VRNVAKALVHLATLNNNLNGNVYIISSDNEECNTFKQVEECLALAIGQKKRKFPLIPFPGVVLSLILKLRRRSHYNMNRKYDSSKIMLTGLTKIDSVEDAICAYAKSIK